MSPVYNYVTELQLLIHFTNVVGYSLLINPWLNVKVLTHIFVFSPSNEYCSRAEAGVLILLQFENKNLKRKVSNVIFQLNHCLTI